MNALLDKFVNNDFVWDAVVSNLHLSRQTKTDFMNYNCPMCVYRGHRADRKNRGGIKQNANGFGIFCFNCDFRAIWEKGESISGSLQLFMEAVGIDVWEIKKIKYKAEQLKQIIGVASNYSNEIPQISKFKPDFHAVDLPPNTKPLEAWAIEECTDPNFLKAAEYALSRGDEILKRADLHWSPEPRWSNRIIIPYKFKDDIIGYTGRTTVGVTPKYLNDGDISDFIYNNHLLYSRSHYVILVEGVLDAAAISGISTFGAKISTNQLKWIKSSNKKIIVVPDRDDTGQRLIDRALENDWMVAFPRLVSGKSASGDWWIDEDKDCAEAVRKYGRLYTIRSIVETATNNKLEINVKRKWLF